MAFAFQGLLPSAKSKYGWLRYQSNWERSSKFSQNKKRLPSIDYFVESFELKVQEPVFLDVKEEIHSFVRELVGDILPTDVGIQNQGGIKLTMEQLHFNTYGFATCWKELAFRLSWDDRKLQKKWDQFPFLLWQLHKKKWCSIVVEVRFIFLG